LGSGYRSFPRSHFYRAGHISLEVEHSVTTPSAMRHNGHRSLAASMTGILAQTKIVPTSAAAKVCTIISAGVV
jgi:hypothetical protein